MGSKAVGATEKGLDRAARLVRVAEPPTFHGVSKRYGRYEITLDEILRD